MKKHFTLLLLLTLVGLYSQAPKIMVIETELSMAESAKTELVATGLYRCLFQFK